MPLHRATQVIVDESDGLGSFRIAHWVEPTSILSDHVSFSKKTNYRY